MLYKEKHLELVHKSSHLLSGPGLQKVSYPSVWRACVAGRVARGFRNDSWPSRDTVHRQRPRKDMNRHHFKIFSQLLFATCHSIFRDILAGGSTFQSWNNLLLRQFAEVELLWPRQWKPTAPGPLSHWATPHTSSATNAETTVSKAIRGRSFGVTLWSLPWLKMT